MKSKKQSATSTPLESVFFLDRNLGRLQLAHHLRALGFRIEVHDDHFPQTTKDPEWIRFCSAQGWVIITPDWGIQKEPNRSVVTENPGACVFVLSQNNTRWEEWAAAIVVARPRINRTIKNTSPPFFARISKTGDVTLVGFDEVSKTVRKYGR